MAAVDEATQSQLLFLVDTMVEDFVSRWEHEMSYYSQIHQGFMDHQVGIPGLAYWVSLLDPQTMNGVSQILAEGDLTQIWKDIVEEIMHCHSPPTAEEGPTAQNIMTQGKKKARLTLGNFLDDLCSSKDEVVDPRAKLHHEVEHQIQRYQEDDGLKLQNDEGGYNCPLVWWKENIY